MFRLALTATVLFATTTTIASAGGFTSAIGNSGPNGFEPPCQYHFVEFTVDADFGYEVSGTFDFLNSYADFPLEIQYDSAVIGDDAQFVAWLTNCGVPGVSNDVFQVEVDELEGFVELFVAAGSSL